MEHLFISVCLINPANQAILQCWEQYEECLMNHINPHAENGQFFLPAKKSKIYSYLECLLPDTAKAKEKVKDPKRDFLNKEHWHIHDLNNLYVNRLKTFLDNFFKQAN